MDNILKGDLLKALIAQFWKANHDMGLPWELWEGKPLDEFLCWAAFEAEKQGKILDWDRMDNLEAQNLQSEKDYKAALKTYVIAHEFAERAFPNHYRFSHRVQFHHWTNEAIEQYKAKKAAFVEGAVKVLKDCGVRVLFEEPIERLGHERFDSQTAKVLENEPGNLRIDFAYCALGDDFIDFADDDSQRSARFAGCVFINKDRWQALYRTVTPTVGNLKKFLANTVLNVRNAEVNGFSLPSRCHF